MSGLKFPVSISVTKTKSISGFFFAGRIVITLEG